MARRLLRPEEIGKPIQASIKEGLKDPVYRKYYRLYQLRAAIASAIRSLRETSGMTQARLARRSGMPRTLISRMESLEDERLPTLETLLEVLAALVHLQSDERRFGRQAWAEFEARGARRAWRARKRRATKKSARIAEPQ